MNQNGVKGPCGLPIAAFIHHNYKLFQTCFHLVLIHNGLNKEKLQNAIFILIFFIHVLHGEKNARRTFRNTIFIRVGSLTFFTSKMVAYLLRFHCWQFRFFKSNKKYKSMYLVLPSISLNIHYW